METGDLIRGLAGDLSAPAHRPLGTVMPLAVAAAVLVAAAAFFLLLGPRPGLAEAVADPRVPFKFGVSALLAALAIAGVVAVARPEVSVLRRMALLAAVPLMLGLGVALEFAAVPAGERLPRLVGHNMRLCLTFIPLIGALPLAILLAALRQGAPTRPTLSGALCGAAAGGLAASFYAAHCPDDSPFFVAAWYTLAVLILALAGALAGRLLLRW